MAFDVGNVFGVLLDGFAELRMFVLSTITPASPDNQSARAHNSECAECSQAKLPVKVPGHTQAAFSRLSEIG